MSMKQLTAKETDTQEGKHQSGIKILCGLLWTINEKFVARDIVIK